MLERSAIQPTEISCVISNSTALHMPSVCTSCENITLLAKSNKSSNVC